MTTFPSHRTEINRAMRLAQVSENRATAEALLRVLPESVIARVTGHELSELLDAMWRLSRNSGASAETEVVGDDDAGTRTNGIPRAGVATAAAPVQI